MCSFKRILSVTQAVWVYLINKMTSLQCHPRKYLLTRFCCMIGWAHATSTACPPSRSSRLDYGWDSVFQACTFFQIFNILIGNKWINALNNRLLDISSTYEAHASGAVLISHQRPSTPAPRSCSPAQNPGAALSGQEGPLSSSCQTFLALQEMTLPTYWETEAYSARASPPVPSRLLHFPLPLPLPSFLQAQLSAHALWHNVSRLLSLCSWILSLSLSWFFPQVLRKSHYSELPWWSVVRTPRLPCKGAWVWSWLGN